MSNTLTKTINPQLVEVDFTNKYAYLEKYSTYLDFVSSFSSQLSAYFDYQNALSKADFVGSLKTFYTDLDGRYSSFDNEFLISYIKKYNALADSVKQAIGITNKNSFLSPISDSIGLLTNTTPLLTDVVIPLNDLNVSLYPAPVTWPVSLRNKIRPHAYDLTSELSHNTTLLYRNNLINIQFRSADSKSAHGSNLITDFNAYLAVRNFALEVTKKLSNDFGNLFKLVTYYSNLNDYSGYNAADYTMNLQTIADVSYQLNVEGAMQELDLLGKQIIAARKTLTNKAALVSSTTNPTNTTAQPITPIKNLASNKPAPLNSTAPRVSVLNNTATNAAASPTTKTPANAVPPTPVGITPQERKQLAAPIKTTTENVSKKPNADVVSKLNPLTLKIPTIPPIFSTASYSSALSSPYAAIKAVKDAICKLKSLDINLVLNFKYPKLKDIFTKPDFSKFKNPLSGLLLKAQIFLIKKLLSLIPPLPDFLKIYQQLKDKLNAIVKDLFYCNPGNKN